MINKMEVFKNLVTGNGCSLMQKLMMIFYQVLGGFVLGALGSGIPVISESLYASFYIGIIAGTLLVLIPLSLKMKYLF